MDSGTGVVRLDRVLDSERPDSVASWPWLSRLEMLPVTTLVLLEMDTEDAEAVEAGDWDPAVTQDNEMYLAVNVCMSG